MNRAIPFGRLSRTLAIVPPAICLTTWHHLRRTPAIRLDAADLASSLGVPTQQRSFASRRSRLSPEMVRQVSSGSITGFVSGVVLALFSRTLVFLGGLFAVTCYIGSRYGIDIPHMLRLRKLFDESALWRRTARSPYFSASFAVTFLLAGFARL